MTRFSAWSVFWNGLTDQTGWKPQWRTPELKTDYDVVIVGGGLHGLATAYYLAKSGARVTIVERDSVGGHASGFALGGLSPLAGPDHDGGWRRKPQRARAGYYQYGNGAEQGRSEAVISVPEKEGSSRDDENGRNKNARNSISEALNWGL